MGDFDQRLKAIIGELEFSNAALSVELEQLKAMVTVLQAKVKELEETQKPLHTAI